MPGSQGESAKMENVMQIDNYTLLKDEDVIQELRDAGFKNLEQTKITVKMNEIGKFCAAIDYGENEVTAFHELSCPKSW